MNLRHWLIAYAFYWARWCDRIAVSLMTEGEKLVITGLNPIERKQP